MTIDPGSITLIQTTFLQHINAIFTNVTHYAYNLLYIFAALEIVIFGLVWALQANESWDQLLFKVIKIGIIFFIVQNYAYLIDTIIQSFAQIGGLTANVKHLGSYIFNPALIWQFGYDTGLILLKSAASSSGFGLPLIQILLGMGLLLTFALIGIQVVIQLVGFYLVALIALLLLPFSAFEMSIGMLDQAVRSVFQAGLRVMVLIMVIGIAVTVWNSFDLIGQQQTPTINVTLGLLFSALLFLYLAIQLPKMVANIVGQIITRFKNTTVPAVAIARSTSVASQPQNAGLASMQAATAIESRDLSLGMSAANLQSMTTGGLATPSSVVVQPALTNLSQTSLQQTKTSDTSLANANVLKQSISNTTLHQIKNTLEKMLKMQQAKEGIKKT